MCFKRNPLTVDDLLKFWKTKDRGTMLAELKYIKGAFMHGKAWYIDEEDFYSYYDNLRAAGDSLRAAGGSMHSSGLVDLRLKCLDFVKPDSFDFAREIYIDCKIMGADDSKIQSVIGDNFYYSLANSVDDSEISKVAKEYCDESQSSEENSLFVESFETFKMKEIEEEFLEKGNNG